jgi:hypothetical protein
VTISPAVQSETTALRLLRDGTSLDDVARQTGLTIDQVAKLGRDFSARPGRATPHVQPVQRPPAAAPPVARNPQPQPQPAVAPAQAPTTAGSSTTTTITLPGAPLPPTHEQTIQLGLAHSVPAVRRAAKRAQDTLAELRDRIDNAAEAQRMHAAAQQKREAAQRKLAAAEDALRKAREEARAAGVKRAGKTATTPRSSGPRKPLSDEHKAKLAEGRKRYYEQRKTAQAAGGQ